MPKDPKPAITLRDPATEKTAALDDSAGVRALLQAVVKRLVADQVPWKERLPKDSTERVAAQILRRDGDQKALEILREGQLAAVFRETDLAEDAKKVRESGKRPDELPGLTDDAGRDKVSEDLLEAWSLLWPTWVQTVERNTGTVKQKATITVEFVPESDQADAYVDVEAKTVVGTRTVTRTAKVRRLKSGRYQLELFGGHTE